MKLSHFLVTTCGCVLFSFVKTRGSYSADKVKSMPFFDGGKLNFDIYSGYLTAETGELFYFFTESSSGNSSGDPLVLWLNGGPGCSSLLGAFTELGPFHPYQSEFSSTYDKLEYNPYSWNNFANMLFIESPPCVGFSFPHSLDCSTYETNDNQTKYDNYRAIQSFLNKFEEYKDRPFYISGESYAGHYIPQLATLIAEKNIEISNNPNSTDVYINLEGVAIGNPYTERDSNMFEGWLPAMYGYGIINPSEYESMFEGNCSDGLAIGDCSKQLWNFIMNKAGDLNVYDVNVIANCSSRSFQEVQLMRYLMKSNSFESNLQDTNIWAYPYDPCDEYNLIYYLNDYDLWKALHVNISWVLNNHTWYWCSLWNGYDTNDTTSEYGESMVHYYYSMLEYNIRVLVYSGNDDLVCAYPGTRYWVYGKLNDSAKGNELSNGWNSWHVNGEVGGWYQQWEKFTFLAVRDAGHEVPEYQPARAYAMFRRFLINNYTDVPESLSDFSVSVESYGSSNNKNTDGAWWSGFGLGLGVTCFVACVIFGFVYCKYIKQTRDSAHVKLPDDE